MTTEHTDDYLHPRTDAILATLAAEAEEKRLKAEIAGLHQRLAAIRAEAEETYRQCQTTTVERARQGCNSIGQYTVAAGVAHQFMRLAS